MKAPFLLVTGFGAFEGVLDNPSGRLAEALDRRPDVVGVRLPVTYGGAGKMLAGALEGPARGAAGILSLGVHKGSEFRLEARAGATQPSERADVAGEISPPGPRTPMESGFDLEACEIACASIGTHGVRISQDAGGYVCDFLYGVALHQAAGLGVNALFLHVPPLHLVALADQQRVVNALVDELLAQVRSKG